MSWLVLDASRLQTFTDYTDAASNLDGVILRCGYRGYTNGSLATDSKLTTHYNGIYGKRSRTSTTIKIGYYWTTEAISVEEAEEEAEYINNILSAKHNDFPLFIDSQYGDIEEHSGRADALTVEERTEYLVALGNKLTTFGFHPGIIVTEDWIENNIDYDTLRDANFYFWIVSDTAPLLPSDDYEVWRYTSTGNISGVSGNVNLSNVYVDIANWADVSIDINTLDCWIESPVVYNGTTTNKTLVGIEDLIYLVDYYIEWSNIAVANNNAYATLYGMGIYIGSKAMKYVISPCNISGINMNLERDGFDYTGEEIKPRLIIDTSTTQGQGFSSSQYDIVYTDNIYPGQATVTITGKNNYTGTKVLHFYISGAAPFPAEPHTEYDEYEYCYKAITPQVIIGDLVEGVDFTTEYFNNLFVGTARIEITGIGNYVNTKATITFEIIPYPVSKGLYIRYGESKYTYTGYQINPTFYVYDEHGDERMELFEGRDFTYTLKNNINAGTASIIITGMGNYDNTLYVTFPISPADISEATVAPEQEEYEYNGGPIIPRINVWYNNILVQDSDYSVSYTNNILIGTATANITGKNNFLGMNRTTFEIVQKSGSDYWVLDQAEFIYSGYPCTPTPRCVDDDPVYGVDYTVDYYDNINAGTGRVVITMIGDYQHKVIELQFKIYPKELDYNDFSIEYTEHVYCRQELRPEVYCSDPDLIEGYDYVVEYYHNYYPGDAYLYIRGIGNYTALFEIGFTITRINLEEVGEISLGEGVVIDGIEFFDPNNFSVIANGYTLYPYDDFIFDFITEVFPKNNTFTYTTYIVTGIGSCEGTITSSFYTFVEEWEPDVPVYIPRDRDKLIGDGFGYSIFNGDDINEEEEEPETPVITPIEDTEEEEELNVGSHLSELFIEDVDPVIPDDPPGTEYSSGELIVLREAKYYSSPYNKYPEPETLTGTFYIYSWKEFNNKIRVSISPENAKIVGRITGWVDKDIINSPYSLNIGDKVKPIQFIYVNKDDLSAGVIEKKGKDMYVVAIDDSGWGPTAVVIGLGNKKNSQPVGWVSTDMVYN